ncbi:MAG: hypothetical protein ACLGSD_14450 [Acidobacteriota bacterium]
MPPPLTADAIMARLAANQDKAQAERSRYVYIQHAKMTSRKGKRVMCEEITDYRVTPSGSDSHFQLVKLDGRVWHKNQYVSYDHLAPDNEEHGTNDSKDAKTASDKPAAATTKQQAPSEGADKSAGKSSKKADQDSQDPVVVLDSDGDLDRELVENIRHGLLNDKSKDGVDSGLFPLTSKEQKNYIFQLLGRERMNGHDVYHVVFRPKDKSDLSWKGDAYVDESTFEPILVSTGLSRKIPFAVRALLGTNLPGLGFTIIYAPQPDGVWFPSTFSTEFKIKVLFFFHREILLDAQNRDFAKTHVESKILDGFTPVEKR